MTREALMKSGGADMMDIQPMEASQFPAPDYKIQTQPTGCAHLVPDSANADSPWSNLKVRMAAEYAIDKEAIVKALGYGYMKAGYYYCTPAQTGWTNNTFGNFRTYDVTKAKQLLTEAGYPNGFKTTIICSPTGVRDVVVSVQAYLSKIGINAEIQFPEPAQWTSIQTGSWKNGLLYDVNLGAANNNTGLEFNFGPTPTVYKMAAKPDGWKDVLNASLAAPVPDPALIQKAVQMLYDYATPIVLYYSTTIWAERSYVMDSGHGARGNAQYWNPPFAYLSK
jgi:peptide/nickel transport system substrate-binding protein